MIRQIIVRSPAVEDVVDAAAWYEAHAPGLGAELLDEILRTLHRAADNPDVFRVVHRNANVRRVLTNRVPYRIFFSVVGETLYVHAVLHGARHDRRWMERL
jgi:plasmid stabilization system protein ParE